MKPVHSLLPVLVLLAACGAGGPGPRAAADAPNGRRCFNVRTVSDFSSAGRDAINVRAGGNRYYRLDILGVCPNIDFSFRLALRSRSGSSWVCDPTDAEVIVRGPTGLERCPVVAMRPLTPPEVEAIRHPASRRH
jgi:hypothetical protein